MTDNKHYIGGNANVDDAQHTPPPAPAPRVPWWMWVIIIVCMLPGLSFPMTAKLLVGDDAVVRWLTWFYPAYVLISGFLAWQCYGRRSYLSWIILVLLVMSHACFWYLSTVTI